MMFSREAIDALREAVRQSMSERRFRHTAEVEKMAERIGEIYLPKKKNALRVAALLHDITKEKSAQEHFAILEEHGVPISDIERISVKTLHARTAAIVIATDEKYKQYACSDVISAVRNHTVGAPDMSVFDMIIYLSDYIDESRTFEDCVTLRNYFWDKEPEKMSEDERTEHLWRTMVYSFDFTVAALLKKGSAISLDTINTRNALILKLNKT